jgi:hypothetical protein
VTAVGTCFAKQFSDMMVCDWCGQSWDVNDPDPPRCRVVTGPVRTMDLEDRVTALERRVADLETRRDAAS